MSEESIKPKRVRSGRLRRVMRGAVAEYRGKQRQLVVELDPASGTVAVRLYGCRTRKTYAVTDLFAWGPQLSMFAVPSMEQPTLNL